MPTLTYTQPHHLSKLSDELVAAVPSVAPVPGPDGMLAAQMTLSDDGGELITMTVPDGADEPAIAAVVASHDPTPPLRVIDFAGSLPVSAIARTTDAAPLEVFRFACAQKHLYTASLTITGIDAGNFVSRVQEGRFTWKRTTGNAVIVGVTVVSNLGEAASSSWLPNFHPEATEIVFTVAGAAGRTVDWLLNGQLQQFAPDGL